MKRAKCANPKCRKATSIDVSLLGENELAYHADCLPEEPVDPERVAGLLSRAKAAKAGIETLEGEGKPPSGSSPRRKIPVVTGEQLAISSSSGGDFTVTRRTA